MTINWSTLESGGAVLYIIIFLNIIGVGIMLSKWIEFRKDKKLEDNIRKDIVNNIAKKMSSIGQQKDNRPYALELIRSEIAFYIHQLDNYLPALKLIAMLAPLLGLLGTVWGILLCFNVMSLDSGVGDAALLADGISKALITTVAGLIVAIIHHLGFHFFSGKLQTKEMNLEKSISSELLV